MFLGILCGATLYMITLSKVFIKINVCILKFIKKIINIFIKIISFPLMLLISFLKNVIFKPISFIFVNIGKNIKKSINIFKFSKKAKK